MRFVFLRYWPVLVLALPFAALGLSGCDSSSYSAAIRYLVRTDPLVLDDKLGPERYQPDSPGQLPLMSAKDLLEIPNPYYRKPEEKEQEDLFRSKLLDPTLLSASDRQELQTALDELFGTPAKPIVEGVDDEVRAKLDLTPKTLAEGSRLYRIHCLVCHGVTGNGRGPNSRWINPHPRDYRRGLFKFQSVDQSIDGKPQKPLRQDLIRTLQQGIEGTTMPSFNLLPLPELESMASYVIHLSIRGEAEFETFKNAYTYKPEEKSLKAGSDDYSSPVECLKEKTRELAAAWLAAQGKPIQVVPYPYSENELEASVQRGQALFLADDDKLKEHFPKDDANKLKVAGCISCHKDYGRNVPFKFDVWGTLVRPADLTKAEYRGGRRPVDFYYRIHSGINGANMASFGSNLSGSQIWDLVNFVRVLPYPAMRKKFSVPIN